MPYALRRGRAPAGFAAAILSAACSSEPAPAPLPADHLVVAITGDDGALDAIARYAGGKWDRPPWAMGLEVDQLAAIPSADSTAWSWPDGHRIWTPTERQWDTIGHSAGAVAVHVPDRWHFYSDSAADRPLLTRGLRLSIASPCGYAWSVLTRANSDEPFPHLGDYRTAGVSLSRAPQAVVPPDQRPDVRRIVSALGLEDEESNPRNDPRFTWLGVFRFEDMTIGVLHRLGYGFGIKHAVIELHGDGPQAVSEVRRKLC